MLTFDGAQNAVIDAIGTMRGKAFDQAYRTSGGRTVDSTGAFLIGELERLDQTINMPLASVTYSRDIPMRTDVGIGDEAASFTLSSFAASGMTGNSAANGGKSWSGKQSNQAGGVGVDIRKITQPLAVWEMELKFSIPELESAARLGRPIDAQKLDALNLKFQMDADAQAYIGDADTGAKGLLNSSLVTNVSNVVNGASGSAKWTSKTPAEILNDVNELITSVWTASGFAVMPDTILIPPQQFGYISTQTISSAGNVSILKYLLENNILVTSGRGTISIQPVKYAMGAGTGGTIGVSGNFDLMMAYAKDPKYVQFPITPLQRTPVQYVSLYHATTYYARIGQVEARYGETFGYRVGL